jgi:hypothetical protein
MVKNKIALSTKTKAAQSAAEVELVPDAWERFEKAVDKVAKSPPQHRTGAPKEGPKNSDHPKNRGV